MNQMKIPKERPYSPRVNIPRHAVDVIAFWDMQENISQSLMILIRMFIKKHGYVDVDILNMMPLDDKLENKPAKRIRVVTPRQEVQESDDFEQIIQDDNVVGAVENIVEQDVIHSKPFIPVNQPKQSQSQFKPQTENIKDGMLDINDILKM